MPIDPSRAFKPVRIAILTVSDTRTLEDDRSGDVLVHRAEAAGHEVVAREIVVDDCPKIEAQLRSWVEDEGGRSRSRGAAQEWSRGCWASEAQTGRYKKLISGRPAN